MLHGEIIFVKAKKREFILVRHAYKTPLIRLHAFRFGMRFNGSKFRR
jgi:hypothetical protein